MADPFRMTVLNAMTSVLERVTFDPANDGTTVVMAGKVFRGRSIYGEGDPLPMISILEPPIPLETLLSQNADVGTVNDWELLIQGFVDDDPLHPSDPAHRLMAVVKSELVKEKRRDRGKDIFGIGYGRGRSGVVDLLMGQGSVRPADDVSAKTYFWLTLTLKLSENLEDPYA